jgi:Mn-dependent DtxR family transcriptional regulator
MMEDDRDYAVRDIAAELKTSVKNVDNLLRRLIDDGLVTRTGRGMYARIPRT